MEKVKQLVAAGIYDINARDKNGWTPLHCSASSDGKLSVLQCPSHLLSAVMSL